MALNEKRRVSSPEHSLLITGKKPGLDGQAEGNVLKNIFVRHRQSQGKNLQ